MVDLRKEHSFRMIPFWYLVLSRKRLDVLRKHNSFSQFSNKMTRKVSQLPESRSVCLEVQSSILKCLSEIFQLGSAPSRII